MLGKLVRLLDQVEASWLNGRAEQPAIMIAVQPGRVDNQRIATPALGEVTSENAGLLAKALEFQGPTLAAVSQSKPAGEQIRVDGGDRPAAESVQETSACHAIGVRIAGLPRQATGCETHRDGMTPEMLKRIGSFPRAGWPPAKVGHQAERIDLPQRSARTEQDPGRIKIGNRGNSGVLGRLRGILFLVVRQLGEDESGGRRAQGKRVQPLDSAAEIAEGDLSGWNRRHRTGLLPVGVNSTAGPLR